MVIIYIEINVLNSMSTQITKTTQNTNQSNNVFAIYKQNVQKCFDSISKNTPQYFQTTTHFQEECMKAAQKSFDAAITMQQEFAQKSGLSTDIPEAAKTVIVDFNKQVIQASNIQNQIVKTTVDTTTQNVKTFNDNVTTFTDLNKNIIQSWINTCTPTRN
jgi:gamma-glutamyl:cysteine ligase YbdK (ATP-grasp superfamily)|tara:strand:+ start:215 stop:694 length:480 start_codon:yes stop_codon:yes gene_type:complete